MTATESHPRSPGIAYQELLDADTHPVPDVLRLQSPRFLGVEDVPRERYTSREWHRLEVERVWKRVWQFVCREEHLPTPGDNPVYELAELPFLAIRTESGQIKAYPKTRLHGGRRLKDHEGHCSEIRCSFHGFAWALDGTLADVPAAWDFDHVLERQDEFLLPECQVGTWTGFVFINPDPQAGPLEEFIGELADHFAVWDLTNRYVEASFKPGVTLSAYQESKVRWLHHLLGEWVGDDGGRWIRGELRECDPQLCGWVGGPQIANHRVTEQPGI